MTEAIVVGGGFFGTCVAHYLKTTRQFARVTLIERESEAMMRASYANQARVHGGYHYLRSFTTAYRSRVNLARFCAEFPGAVDTPFQSIYALATQRSKMTRRQMERFCAAIDAPLGPLPDHLRALLQPRMIAGAWLTEEKVFDSRKLRAIMLARLCAAGVDLQFGRTVQAIFAEPGRAGVRIEHGIALSADYVFNCSYANLQNLAGPGAPDFNLAHEIAEVALVTPPAELAEVGITVMDGPFFSCIPFPARGLHSLTHVRYTPHRSWADRPGEDPDQQLEAYDQASSVDWMIRDAARFVPAMVRAVPVASLFEVKTILRRNAGDDGRPILFERHGAEARLVSILGGKLDNIYDALQRLDQESFEAAGVDA